MTCARAVCSVSPRSRGGLFGTGRAIPIIVAVALAQVAAAACSAAAVESARPQLDTTESVRLKVGAAAVRKPYAGCRWADARFGLEASDPIAAGSPPATEHRSRTIPVSEWTAFPDEPRAFRPLLADQREAQIRVGFMYGRHGQKFADLGFGGDIGLARKDISPTDAMTVSVRGLMTARFNTCASSFPQQNTDYFGGVAFGHRFGSSAYEVYLFHQSAHLGDEVLDSGERQRINFGREAVRVLLSHDFGNLRIYAGPTTNMTASESFLRGKTALQAGAEYRCRQWGRLMYAALDAQANEETNWRPGVTGQLGVQLTDGPTMRRSARVFLEFYNGYSRMGQFWNVYESFVMLGVAYNW